MKGLTEFYGSMIKKQPLLVVLLVAIVGGLLAMNASKFRLDASADSLLLEGDVDLQRYQKMKRLFGGDGSNEADEYLVIAYTPDGDLFKRETLDNLERLVKNLEAIEGVTQVVSLFDAPLFQSPPMNLMQLAMAAASGLPTIAKPTIDLEMARKELTTSALYQELLIDNEGETTAMLVMLKKDEAYLKLSRAREDLQHKKYDTGLSDTETGELAALDLEYKNRKAEVDVRMSALVAEVRSVMAAHTGATMFLGGVPMIVADMSSMVERDLSVFGGGVMLFLVLTLGVIFRRPRWVILPLLCCIVTVAMMIGLLGLLSWPATVISSNFVSLLFIITMSMAIHIIVRYRELGHAEPDADHKDLVLRATILVARPCFYCALTTMVGFGSLIVSGIQPVIDFGSMMFVGIGVSYLVVFLLFPAMLSLLPKAAVRKKEETGTPISARFATLTEAHGNKLLLAAGLVVALGLFGISRLTVENRFVDYFKESTEINQGMQIVDRKLGGTTPLEIVLTGEGNDYWFKPDNLAKLRKVHQFLEAQPEIGKVISVDTMMVVVEKINGGQPLNGFLLGMLRRALPKDIKEQILRPYANEDFTKVRLVARIKETNPELQREVLLGKIETFLAEEGYTEDTAMITGLYVLYNNLLQSLFYSQIVTIGMVFFAVWVMFCILFRSIWLATLALVPNIFPVVLVLGSLGLAGIPLDIMTITIAAITIGIAVDQTIHYIHRFKAEFKERGNYIETMHACHRSIGKAMYYTSVTIIAGFSILVLSSFNPTIYFGFFTALAMVAALLGSLTLLPHLVVSVKPLGAER